MATRKSASVETSAETNSAAPTPAKATKPAAVPTVGLEISKDGKSGQIIWEGDQGSEKVFKVRWADGGVTFCSASDLI